jgi:hypothetical protein
MPASFASAEDQPLRDDRQPLRQASSSKSQLRLAGGLMELVDVQPFPQTERHNRNMSWQLLGQKFWTILFFGMGVKLPAKLVVIEERRNITATASLMYASIGRIASLLV